jgi:hypothetical protein
MRPNKPIANRNGVVIPRPVVAAKPRPVASAIVQTQKIVRLPNGHKRVWNEGRSKYAIIGACKLKYSPVGIKFKDFVHALIAYPTVPSTCDWSQAAIAVIENVEGNDNAGDCVEAEEAHFIGVVTGNANTLFAYTPQMTLALYTAETGYNASNPNTDQGTDPIADLNYLTQNPYADGSKLAGWALVDASSQSEVKYAVYTLGNGKLWLGLPAAIIQNMPSKSGFVWDVTLGAADPNNGHCIGICGFNSVGVQIMTWGMIGTITWAALAAWCVSAQGGGMAVRVTTDWISSKTGQAPSGLNLSALISAFNTYFGGSIPVPTPAPAPTPPLPPATSPPSLAAAQSAVESALMTGFSLITESDAIARVNAALTPLWPPS